MESTALVRADCQFAEGRVFFRRGESELDPSARIALDAILPELTACVGGTLQLRGFVDDAEASGGVVDLTTRRANTVRDYIAARGVTGSTIAVVGAPPGIGDADTLNRRVEIRYVESAPPAVSAQQTAGPSSAFVSSDPGPSPTPAAMPTPVAAAAGIAGRGEQSLIWSSLPSEQELARLYPAAARQERVEGRVALRCRIRADLSAACSVLSEEPRGYGFDGAALLAAYSLRVTQIRSDGLPSEETEANVVIHFRHEFIAPIQ